jgi:hypothetical protein
MSRLVQGDDEMYVMADRPDTSSTSDPVAAARVAIWRLFEEGYVDEDMATAGLLAVDLGTRRAQRKPPNGVARRDGTERSD